MKKENWSSQVSYRQGHYSQRSWHGCAKKSEFRYTGDVCGHELMEREFGVEHDTWVATGDVRSQDSCGKTGREVRLSLSAPKRIKSVLSGLGLSPLRSEF